MEELIAKTYTPAAKGIGGWLILFVIGLVVNPLRILFLLYTNHVALFTGGAWQALTTPESEASHVLWAPFLVFEILGNIVIMGLGFFTLWLLIRKSKHLPKAAIILVGGSTVFVLADFFLGDLIPAVAAQSDPASTKELIRSIISAMIWIPYFLVSKRVKATFVE